MLSPVGEENMFPGYNGISADLFLPLKACHLPLFLLAGPKDTSVANLHAGVTFRCGVKKKQKKVAGVEAYSAVG